MQIGIYEKAINNKWDWETKILIAKRAGYDFIEFSIDESDQRLARLDWTDQEITNLQKLLIKHDFNFNSMTLSAHRRFPFGSLDCQTRKRGYEIINKAVLLAKKLHIYNIQLAGYDVYYELSTPQTRKYFVEGIKYAVQLAQEHTIMLSFEIMDTPFMGTITRALKYLKLINSPWLKIYPDIGNIYQWATKELEDEFVKGQNQIVGLHFKDTRPNVFREVPWGKGTVDFVRVFQILNKINYTGPFLIEMWSKNNNGETEAENINELKSALKFFHNQRVQGGYNGFSELKKSCL